MGASPESGFRGYMASFDAFDVDVLMSHYDVPCVFVTTQFSVPVADTEQLRGVLGAQLDQMKADQWKRSEVRQVRTHELGPTLAIVSCEVIRYDTSDNELNRFRAAYTLRHRDRWLVTAVAVGDPAKGEWTEESLGQQP